MMNVPAPVMDTYQPSIGDWFSRHFGGRQGISDPAKLPLTHPIMPQLHGFGHQPGFTPGLNIGQLLMRHQGAQFMEPNELWQSRYSQ